MLWRQTRRRSPPARRLVYTMPVGLNGEFSMNTLVLSVMAASSCSAVILKSLLGCGYDDRDCTCLLLPSRVAYPVRSRDNDLIARVAASSARYKPSALRPKPQRSASARGPDAVLLFQTVTGCLAQVHQTGCRRVPSSLVVLNDLDTDLLDVLGVKSGSPAAKARQRPLPSAFICLNNESMASVVDACTPAAILKSASMPCSTLSTYLSSDYHVLLLCCLRIYFLQV